MSVLGAAPPPHGGIDLSLPGVDVRLGATRWPGRGSPIVLLHGLASQRRFWNLVVPGILGRPVLALDQRGHGDSDRPDEPYDASTVAADLATALDALGWSRAVVVGHSWGATTAATFAVEYPHRTLAVVAIDGGFSTRVPEGPDRDAARARLTPPRWVAPAEEVVAHFRASHPAGYWNDDLAAAVLPIFAVGDDGLARARLPFEIHMRIVEALLDYDAPTTLPRIACPTWLVSCEPPGAPDDWTRLKAAMLEQLAPSLARPRLFRWSGAVHDVPLQWPALVAGLVRAAADDAQTTGGSVA